LRESVRKAKNGKDKINKKASIGYDAFTIENEIKRKVKKSLPMAI
jgi:hypothetical protein